MMKEMAYLSSLSMVARFRAFRIRLFDAVLDTKDDTAKSLRLTIPVILSMKRMRGS
jgi:hypothetical protein